MKAWLQGFPGTDAMAATVCFLVLTTGLVVEVKLIRGQDMPGGYDGWFYFLATLAIGSGLAVVGKRLTDIDYKKAGTSPVTVGGPSTVNVAAPPASAARPDPNPGDA